MKYSRFLCGMAFLPVLIVPAHAQISGTVDATITLDAGCIINGQSYDDGDTGVDFGTLDFGTQNTLFTTADAQVLSGSTGVTVQCSNGITPTMSFETGQNDGAGAGAGVHSMAHQTEAGRFVTYNLYTDAGRTAIIPVGGTISLSNTGAAQTVNVYGRAFGEAGLTPGVYSDVVTVVIEL